MIDLDINEVSPSRRQMIVYVFQMTIVFSFQFSMSTLAVPSLNIPHLPTHENQSFFSLFNAITRIWAIYLALDYKEKSTQMLPIGSPYFFWEEIQLYIQLIVIQIRLRKKQVQTKARIMVMSQTKDMTVIN